MSKHTLVIRPGRRARFLQSQDGRCLKRRWLNSHGLHSSLADDVHQTDDHGVAVGPGSGEPGAAAPPYGSWCCCSCGCPLGACS